jgi:hypothetical protein
MTNDEIAKLLLGPWVAHTGVDYTVVMLPEELTENASIWVHGEHAPELAKRIAVLPELLTALDEIIEGCSTDGRWLDAAGNECDETDEGATWTQYTGEEQDQWILSVADIARRAKAKVEA